jgi:hypothetical protein
MCLSLTSCGASQSSAEAETAKETEQTTAEVPAEADSEAEAEPEQEAEETPAPEEVEAAQQPEAEPEADEQEEAEQDPYPYYPWIEPLPDGIEATVQKLGDFELLIRYKNNTGKDISIYSECQFMDASGDPSSWMSGGGEFVKAGGEYLEVMWCDDYFDSYLLYCEIGDVGARIQKANDALTIESSRNADGSVHIVASTTADDGAAISGYVFFTGDDGEILGYESVGWGFAESEMEGDTEIPDFEYADYVVCVYATA